MEEEEAKECLSLLHKIESVKIIFDGISREDILKIRKMLYKYIPVSSKSENIS